MNLLCFCRKFPTDFGSTIGDLWDICGLSVAFYKRVSIIMLQKSSAWKGFCAEDWRMWRVKWYIQHAGSIVFTRLPAWVYFFEKSFLRAKVMPNVWLNYNRFILSKRKSSILMYCTPLLSVHGRISSRTTTILVYESSIRVSELISCCRFSSSAIVNAD